MTRMLASSTATASKNLDCAALLTAYELKFCDGVRTMAPVPTATRTGLAEGAVFLCLRNARVTMKEPRTLMVKPDHQSDVSDLAMGLISAR